MFVIFNYFKNKLFNIYLIFIHYSIFIDFYLSIILNNYNYILKLYAGRPRGSSWA